jgi:ATP-binding cassette subfamily B protein
MIAIVVVQAYLMLKMPEYVGKITNLISPKEKVVNFRSELWQYGFAMLGFAIATFVAAIGAGFTSSLLGSRVGKNLRTAVFNKVESFSLGEINKFSTPSLITRSVNDIQQISMAITM